jgi:predicted MFS family arabinose efflux permease
VRSNATPALTVLFLVNILNFYDRLALSAVVEPIRREFRLSDAQIGALVTWFTVVLALAGIPLGRLADTGSRRRLLAAGIVIWAGLTGLAAAATSYAMLLITRLGVGVGEAVCAPTAASWIGDLVPANRRGRAMATFMMAVPVGGLLSYAITGPVAQAHGWRFALAVAAAPMLVLIPAVLLLGEPARGSGVGGQARQSASGSGLWEVVTLRRFWWICASGAVINFALYGFATFLAAFLTRYHGWSVARAGVWVGIGTGVSGIAGALSSGAIGDRVGSKLKLAAVVSFVAAVPLFAAFSVSQGEAAAALVLAMLGYGMLQMYYGLVYASIQDMVAPELRATAMATYLMVTYLGGASWGPMVMGRVSDWLAGPAPTEAARAAGLHGAMFMIPALAVLLGVVLSRVGVLADPTGNTSVTNPLRSNFR